MEILIAFALLVLAIAIIRELFRMLPYLLVAGLVFVVIVTLLGG